MKLTSKIKLTWLQFWVGAAIIGWLCTVNCLIVNHQLRQTIIKQWQYHLAQPHK